MADSPLTDPWSLELLITSGGARSATERRSISRDAERGALVRLRPGALVARAAFDAMTPEEQHIVRMRAAAAVSPRPVVFSHWSSAVLHGLPVLRSRLAALHTTTGIAAERHRPGTTSHLFALSRTEVTRLGGLTTTTLARTVIDVAGGAPFEEGVMVADAALVAGVPRAVLEEAVDLAGLRRSSARIDDVVAFGHPGAGSAAESMLRVTLLRIGMEVPELQHRIILSRGRSAHLDAFLRSSGIGIETDGARKYLDPAPPPRAPAPSCSRRSVARTRCGCSSAGSSASGGGSRAARRCCGRCSSGSACTRRDRALVSSTTQPRLARRPRVGVQPPDEALRD